MEEAVDEEASGSGGDSRVDNVAQPTQTPVPQTSNVSEHLDRASSQIMLAIAPELHPTLPRTTV